jgi:hypothetical protein
MKVRIWVLCLALALLAGSPVLGQSITGTILGRVLDPSGAAVPNAAVIVTNTGTNARFEARTEGGGNYTAPQLAPGNYVLEASAQGFKKFHQEGIRVAVEAQVRLDITLTVGELAESVNVVAEAAQLETTNAALGKVVDNRAIVNLPLNTRNVYSLIFSTPGVTGYVGNNYGEMRYGVNGARARMMDTLIDGVTASHATVNGFAGISVFPSVDAIEEFKVMSANYSAEFGRSMGSVLNVVFKSGTNQFHGSVYEFLRNSVLDSNNFFDNMRGRKLASFKRSQAGYVLSGPLRHDKTFFMTSLEILRARTFANSTTTVPTVLERRGDFSQTFTLVNNQPVMVQVFNPFTTRRSGSAFVRDPFPGNVVPASMFDPVAPNVIKYYPQPNTPGRAYTNADNYSQSGSAQNNITQHDYRIDHNISPKQRFFARYSTRLNESVPLKSFPQDLTIAEGRIVEEDHVHGAVADYTNTLSPTMIFTARAGFARTLYVYNNQGLGFVPSSLGLPRYIDLAADYLRFPVLSASGYVGLGAGDHRRNAFMSYTWLGALTKISGRHTVKTGFETRLIRTNVFESSRSSGNFSFSTGWTRGPDPQRAAATAGNGMASLLLGTADGSLILNYKNDATQSFYYAAYVQDDWRITNKLSLSIGLRWDMDTPRTERYDRTNYFDQTVQSPLSSIVPGLQGGLVFLGRNGVPRTQFPYDWNNFAPRIGLAYQLNSKTVFRAGYALVYGASLQAAAGTIGTQGFRSDFAMISSLDGVTPLNLLRNPFPDGFPPPPGASAGLLTQLGQNIEAVTRDTVSPMTRQINFNIQRELPFHMLFEVAYVSTRGYHLNRSQEGGISLNQLPASFMAQGTKLNELVANPFYGKGGTGVIGQATVSRGQLARPYPQFSHVLPIYQDGANSWYNSLQTTLNKRISRGLGFSGSYTWAKMLDENQSHQDSYNIRASRALSDQDLAHRFVMGYVYELPFGRNRRFGGNWSKWLDLAVGQWQFNGITTFQSGTPIGMSVSNTAGIYNQTLFANNNGKSGKLSGPVHQRLNRYFDTSVFSQPPPFTFGNMTPRVPDIRVDGIRSHDLSLFKDFRILERLRAQFRGEFLNAFNTPRFGGPNTSVTSSSFGVISSQANAPRQIQFGLKLLW